MSKEFICKGCGEKFNKDMQSNNVGYCYICNEFYMRKQVADLEAKLAEKEKEINDLKEWQNWYSMWHKKFQKNIEELQTELETYRPTKLKGDGQCVCYGCEQKGEFGRFWTDWCSKYKGHIYCDKCLKDLLEKEKENV